MGQRVIGHIEGVGPGEVFDSRDSVRAANLHGERMRGISRLKGPDGDYVADAIVLNGGYEDDEDGWTWIKYTGASPDVEKYKNGKTLLRSQSWEYRDNAALKLSFERGHFIRIIRGPKGDQRYSLPGKYRYDGLYEITDARTAISKSAAPDGSPIEICQFLLKRLSDAQQEFTPAERKIAEVLAQQEQALEIEAASAQGDDSGFGNLPVKRAALVQRIVRDSAVARRIKSLYDNECQICSVRLIGPDRKPYSEGAHIRPLGGPHCGPDVERNVLCLCPNCHVRFDIGAIVIDEDWSIVVRAGIFGENVRRKLKRHGKHKIHSDYIRYHRNWWIGEG